MLKTGGFLRFWGSRKCPEDCAHDSFCFIRPFFREMKNERKSPKNVKNWGFLAIFSCSKQPSAGILFLRFWCARICAYDLFCLIRPSPNPVPR